MEELDLLHLPPGGQRGGGGGLRGPGHGARVTRSAGHGAGPALVLRPGAAAAGGLQHGLYITYGGQGMLEDDY